MITVFARDYGQNIITGQSAYFGPSSFPGASWLESNADPLLRIQDTQNVGGDGLTFATWVKPDWGNTLQGAPALFMELNAPAQTPFNQQYLARFGYDSETTGDEIFLHIRYYEDTALREIWINAPLQDPINQAITGIAPSGPTNSWNSQSSPGFVHLAVILDMTTQSWPEFTTDISPRAIIFWNGQVLNTYEYFTSNPALLNLTRFTDVNPILSIGPKIWNRAHWQDRSIYNTYSASSNDITNLYHANGTPSDPPANADFHWNFENTGPYTSNGIQPQLTLNQQRTAPGSFPAFDPINFV
jgi:hypothetical protein